ncbi:hypothetical protein JCM19240_1972 [Vibrio maritimus]|uniref:Uncharacterized protein n=1 Tax=Vibrio maritimus TaxID=990268 RepID=A0A090SZZ8_9VIBR|nr:hypothetical protein JCM19240_1972 [Vibrio maritimus]
MSNHELQQQIDELQAQLNSMEEQDELQQNESELNEEDKLEALISSATPNQLIERLKVLFGQGGEEGELQEKCNELIAELEIQLEQLPPKACLLIFSAGIVFGRVLR